MYLKNCNHRYLRLAGIPIEDFPETQIHDTWAVFKDDLEEIFKESIGNEVYNLILEEVASELGYENRDRACKNLEGASRFIELVYDKAHRIKPLEKVVQMITKLRDLGSMAHQ